MTTNTRPLGLTLRRRAERHGIRGRVTTNTRPLGLTRRGAVAAKVELLEEAAYHWAALEDLDAEEDELEDARAELLDAAREYARTDPRWER